MLICIIVNLLIVGAYLDIALRDFGLFLAAIALVGSPMSTATASASPANGPPHGWLAVGRALVRRRPVRP